MAMAQGDPGCDRDRGGGIVKECPGTPLFDARRAKLACGHARMPWQE